MKKILLVGKDSCFSENLCFLLKISGFDPVSTTNLEQAINLIEIKPNFRLLIIPRSELVDVSTECLGFLKRPDHPVKVIIMENAGCKDQQKLTIDKGLISKNISICFSDTLIEEVKSILSE